MLPATKRLVCSLCLKSQIRYPARLAPWTSKQYLELTRVPAELLRPPPELIYAPENVGGCTEMEVSSLRRPSWENFGGHHLCAPSTST